jgi:UDP-glucose 4-epimerase
VVEALVGLIRHPLAVGEVFNVGNDEEISILALANQVKNLTKSTSEVRLVPYVEAYAAGFEDMMRRVPDLAKIRALLEFRPRRDLTSILNDVISSDGT